EVEYPRAFAMGQFENVVVGRAEQMLSENLARVHSVGPARKVRRQELPAFAAIERRAVGRDGQQDVLLAEFEVLCGLDCGDQVGDTREAQILQLVDRLRSNSAAVRQVGPAGLVVEQQVERRSAA